MSDSQAYDKVRISSEGVTVTKRFEEDEFPVPAIAFEFESDRDESVSVTLTDTVPEGVEVEDLGFHPEYGSEFWTIEDEIITFEKELEANATYTTVYGIRATDTDDVEQFLTEPTLENVDPPLPGDETAPGEDVVPESGDDVIKDAITGDGEIPGLEDEESQESVADEDVETLDLKDPNSEGGAVQSADGEAAESTDEQTAESSAGGEPNEISGDVSVDGSVVSALAAEIRDGAVSAEDVKLLRRAFEVAGQEGGTVNAQIRQLQTDIADLRAYTGSLEEFLDENGTGKQLLEEFDAQLDEFEEQLNGMQAELETVDNDVETIESGMADVVEEVEDLGEEVETVSDDMSGFSGDIEDINDDVEGLEDAIDGLESDIEELEENVTGADVDERVDSIEEQLEDLQNWQDQIKSTFGG